MMRVWIMRHGESQTNRDGLWGGQLDAPLTERGKAQAEEAGKRLAGVRFDKIYASDLSRAMATAEAAVPNCRYETRVGLREMDVGRLAGTPYADLDREARGAVIRDGYGIYGGETKEAFRTRIAAFMEELEKTEYQNVAVFTHAGCMRQFFELATGMEFSRGHMLCGNCATAVYEYDNGVWRLHSWFNLL